MGTREFAKELRSMSYEDIENTLSDKKMAILRMRNEGKQDDIKITKQWITTKKDIARCLTILGEKKRNEIKEQCEKEGKPLPKILREKRPRKERVNVSKKTLQRYSQSTPLRRKVVVFNPTQ
ncbi:hypothetical protein NEFER03_0484 [Nematocida sp. LUAm3]|nr:hypothetical protein NEFER03_0484 [Nematocida sp. LUAm3]KAI5175941.1 hypothetical protein NEFER02_1801 [Nematocida sp. LUAm2]KAI5178677.1 hypothetical protein NEFER01_1796 [Nematocida sp. LUAm1]